MTPPRTALLLLQEPVADARIWAPLAEALRDAAEVLEADPPMTPMLFAEAHWAVHAADWIATRSGDRPIAAVAAHGHAAAAALEAARRGLVQGAVVLIDPSFNLLMGDPGEAARAKIHDVLGTEAAQGRLMRLFTALPAEDMRRLRETGRLDAAGAARFAEAITAIDDDRDEPYELAKAMITERLTAAFADGVQWRLAPLDIDFPGIAASLGARLHVALTPQSMIDTLGLRDRLASVCPRAVLHALPGPNGPAGWWRATDAYADLVRSVI